MLWLLRFLLGEGEGCLLLSRVILRLLPVLVRAVTAAAPQDRSPSAGLCRVLALALLGEAISRGRQTDRGEHRGTGKGRGGMAEMAVVECSGCGSRRKKVSLSLLGVANQNKDKAEKVEKEGMLTGEGQLTLLPTLVRRRTGNDAKRRERRVQTTMFGLEKMAAHGACFCKCSTLTSLDLRLDVLLETAPVTEPAELSLHTCHRSMLPLLSSCFSLVLAV